MERYNIHLNNSERYFQRAWQELQNEETFYDVTLACEDKQLQAHKVILSASSPVLKDILKYSHQNTFIYLRGVKYTDLQNMVNFMYQGEATVEEEDLVSFLSAAKDLNIKGLSKTNEYQLKSIEPPTKMHTIENINDGILVSKMHDVAGDGHQEVLPKMEITKNVAGDGHQEVLPKMEITENVEDQRKSLVSLRNSFSCEICKKLFATNNNLKKHIQSLHEGVCYPCDHCSYRATDKGQLKKHVEAIHDGIRYQCTHCHYKATEKGYLKKHIRSVHEGIRYACDQCDHKATLQTRLNRHIKSVHKTVQRY